MARIKPSVPKGTRDFIPEEAMRRKYIFSVIEEVFMRYGYLPVETPAMENLSTLMGKYGDEGDRLIFKILNSGDFLSGIEEDKLTRITPAQLSGKICEKGLRYDLTVPFARFVVQHRNELHLPFKRYQIQPVWRADKPQKGRYREFYQCDVDVIGSDSLLNEAELIMIMEEVFRLLEVEVEIKLNNRKILTGIAEYLNKREKLGDLTLALDKRDKIGDEEVLKDLEEKGFTHGEISKIKPLLAFTGDTAERYTFLKGLISTTKSGEKGLEEMDTLLSLVKNAGVYDKCYFDFTLARGLDYYTGTIFEVNATQWSGGSICGGGRYDNLTSIFGLENMSGVGVSFGADRIYDVLAHTEKFPEEKLSISKVLVLNFGEKELSHLFPLVKTLRERKISTEVYPDPAKIKKQLQYANQKKIPFVILAGEEEITAGRVSLKNMATGEQKQYFREEVIEVILSEIAL